MSTNYTLSLSISAEQLPSLLALASKQGLTVSMVSAAAAAAPSAATTKAKKPKKEKDPNAPKREPSAWIKFTSRVRLVLVSLMEGQLNAKGAPRKPLPKEVTQTASSLKEQGKMDSCKDAEIVEAFRNWESNPPSISKWEATHPKEEGEDSEEAEESEAPEAPAVVEAAKKPRKPWSEETKKAAAAKRAAKKAGAATAAVPAPVAVAPPAAPAAAAVAGEEDEEEDEEEEDNPNLAFAPFVFKKVDYMKNLRGDVITLDQQWVGRYDEAKKTLDRKFVCPEDLGL